MIKLYDSPFATCPRKARFALEEKGVEYAREVVSEEDRAVGGWFRRYSPFGLLPVLSDDDRVIRESSVVCEYVNDAFDGPELMPADSYQRARARIWMTHIEVDIHVPHNVAINFGIAFAHNFQAQGQDVIDKYLAGSPPVKRQVLGDIIKHQFDSPWFEGAVLAYDRLCADIEDSLASSDWLAGDRFSLAEVGVVPWIWRLAREFGLQGLFFRDRPRTADWLDRVAARPAFSRAINVEGSEGPIRGMAARGPAALEPVAAILERAAA